MSVKSFFAATLSFIGTASLSAQTLAPMRVADMGDSEVANIVGQLENNALLVLLGVIVFMGIIWVCAIWKGCVDLRQKSKNTRASALFLLLFAVGLSTLGSSCTPAQRARAAEMRAAQAADPQNCPSQYHHRCNADNPINNGFPSHGSSNWRNPSFCQYCGKWVVKAPF